MYVDVEQLNSSDLFVFALVFGVQRRVIGMLVSCKHYFNTGHSHSTLFAVNDELSNTIGLHSRSLGPW